MKYQVAFVINGEDARLEREFTRKEDAENAAAGLEEEGYPTEVINTTEL